MDWGNWEGRKLECLRKDLGAEIVANEARGLDMRPEGGESPREVRERVNQWLSTLNQENHDIHVAVTHKGVIRAAISLATGWDMTHTPPIKLKSGYAYSFKLAPKGNVLFKAVISMTEKSIS